MGYQTRYDLSYNPYDSSFAGSYIDQRKEIEAFVAAELDMDPDVLDELTSSGLTCKWYSHRADMLQLSAAFPLYEFTLSGDGENQGDVWEEEYHNGKYRRREVEMKMGEWSTWST